MPKKKPTKVYRYDGQSICTSLDSGYASYSDYELGSFLGGGAAGVVYEAECFKTKRHLAVKVLNPIGFKLAPSGSLRFCEVVIKGQPYGDAGGGFSGRGFRSGGLSSSSGSGGSGGPGKMSEKHVWWLVNASTRQMIAAYYDARTGILKEMTLPKCIEVWGLGDDKGRRGGGRGGGRDRGKRDRERDRMKQEDRIDRVFVGGEWLTIPSAPTKYDKFLRARASIFLEISNMLQLSEHPNILRLHEALELVQDSKATIFLVLELARGGELFDRIKVDCGADEGAARHYFRQLLSGVRHCHDRGVCHRDLKPENLLLADPDDSSVLKIADFGFSALFRELESESSSGEDSSSPTASSSSNSSGRPGLPPPSLRRQASTGLSSSMGSRARAAGGAGGAGGGSGAVGAIGAGGGGGGGKGRGVRRLTSVVGSPYYVAPEVLREESGHGYDGTKADVWSMGVILYAMLAGNLPFEKELLVCSRFAKFGAWARQVSATTSLRSHCSGNPKDAMDMDRLDYPSWFFPQHFSYAARSLLSGLLHPDASSRISVRQALRHPWVLDGRLHAGSGGGSSSDGSDFSVGVGGGGVEDDLPRSPDPQDIPSELLGADSDTEGEEDHGREGGECGSLGLGGGRRNNSGRGWRREHHRPMAQPSPPPVPVPAPASVAVPLPMAVVATVPTVRQDDVCGSSGSRNSGRGGNRTGGGAIQSVELSKGAPPPPPVSTGVLRGIKEEDAAEIELDVERGPTVPGNQATSGSDSRAGEGEEEVEGGARQASPKPPLPPPSPPPQSPLPSAVGSSSNSCGPSTPRTEAKGHAEGRGEVGVGDVDLLDEMVGSMSLASDVGVVVSKGGEAVSSRIEGIESISDDCACFLVGVASTAPGVAAEAAKEQATAPKDQAATIAAMVTAVAAAVDARRAQASSQPQAALVTPVATAVGGTSQQQPFATPPKVRSPRLLDVFSSPPLAPLGSGRALEEEESAFLLDAGPLLPPEKRRVKSREGLPPSVPGYARSSGGVVLRALATVERPLNELGVAGVAVVDAESGKKDGVVAVAPPAFHDLVKRSTRFTTSVPAAVVLRKIASIINADAHPLPYPYRNIKQKAVVHQDEYKLEIMRGGVLVCTVQIFLLGGEHRAAQYLVEFLRGQLDIFLFKRFYEDVRRKLNDLVKKDYSLALLESGTCTHRFHRFSNLA